jgi:hypothetical protein
MKKLAYLLTLSAITESSLQRKIVGFLKWLSDQKIEPSLESISYTLNRRRTHFENRIAIIASSISELNEILVESGQGEKANNYLSNIGKTKVIEEPIFHEMLLKIEDDIEKDQSLNSITYKSKLMALGDLYVKGFNINWEKLHRNELQKIISLPIYQYSKNHYEISNNKNPALTTTEPDTKNALDSPEKAIYLYLRKLLSAVLKVEESSILDDQNFNQYNVDTFFRIQILNRINQHYNLSIELNILIENATLNKLAKVIYQRSKHNIKNDTSKVVDTSICITTFSDFSQELINECTTIECENEIFHILDNGIGFWKDSLNLYAEFNRSRFSDDEIKNIFKYKDAIFKTIEYKKKYYPLSYAQKIQCVQSELYKNTIYQLSFPFMILKKINRIHLEKSMKDLISRHEILRTVFPKLKHNFVQLVLAGMDLKIDFMDFSSIHPDKINKSVMDEAWKEKVSLFNISQGPLFRIKCIKIEEEKSIILLIAHHAIFDAISFPIFIRDLMSFYESYEKNVNNNLPIMHSQYSAFILDQYINTNDKKLVQWWASKLENSPSQTDIPPDFKGNQLHSQKSGIVNFTLKKTSQESFNRFCKDENISMTLLIMSGIYLLLHEWAKQSDIVIGTVFNQRNQLKYESLIGDFNNIVPIRLKIENEFTGNDIIQKTKSNFFEAYNHQSLAFINLVRHLHVRRNKSNLPFYNVFFDSINFEIFEKNCAINNIKMEWISNEDSIVSGSMYLFIFLIQESGNINFHCMYNQALLKKTTVLDKLIELEEILLHLVADPTLPILKYIQKNKNFIPIFCPEQNSLASLAQENMYPTSNKSSSLIFKFEGILDIESLKISCMNLIEKHTILRSVYRIYDKKLVFQLLSKNEFDVKYINVENSKTELNLLIESCVNKIFDLNNRPLIQFTLIQLSSRSHIFLVTFHPIIVDPPSYQIIICNLSLFYNGNVQKISYEVPTQTIQYGDFSHWQREWIKSDEAQQQLNFWRDNLPTRDNQVSSRERHNDFPQVIYSYQAKLPIEIKIALKDLYETHHVRLLSCFFAVYQLYISQYTKKTDFIVDLLSAGRTQQQIENLIGVFVNYLPFHVDLSDDITYLEFISRLDDSIDTAYNHSDVPFDVLLKELQPQFSTLFIFNNYFSNDDSRFEGLNTSISLIDNYPHINNYDLVFEVRILDSECVAFIRYKKGNYFKTDPDEMIKYYISLLEKMLLNPGHNLDHKFAITEEKRLQ